MCVAPFCTFLCRFCTILTWNRLTRFIEDVTSDDEILFLFLNLDIVLRNLTSEGFAYIWQSKWVEIIVIKTERTQIHFLSDVFAAIASWVRSLGTLRFNDATAMKTSLNKWICVLSVFIEFFGTTPKYRKRNKISSLLVYVLHKTRN